MMKNAKGAVSIFLVIVLVPMLTFSALFVDYGKVKLAKGVAESAGDLTLNTALTDYDTKLKDMYGLFATSQNTDELYDKLEDYYRTCITSSGVDEEEAQSIAETLIAQLGLVNENNNTADLLNMQLLDFNVQKMSNAHLANAAVLKRQIVEFEKFRAPINTGLSFISSLKSFSELSKQTDLVDKRKKYYEEEKTTLESAEKAWQKIVEYNESGFIKSDDYFPTMKSKFDNYKNDFNEFARTIIKDLYDTQDYVGFTNKNYYFGIEDVEYNGKTESTSVLYLNTAHTSRLATFNERTTYSSTRKASQSNMRNELINFNNALETFKNAQDQLLPLDEGAYGLQFLVQTNRPNTYENWTNAAKNVYDRYAEIRLAAFNAADNVMTYSEQLPFSNSTKTYGTYYNDLMNRYNSLAGIFNGNIGPYTSKLQLYCNSSADKVRTSAISSAITFIHEEIEGYRKTLENAKNALSSAVTELNNVLTAVKSGGTLQTAKNSWNSAADNVKDTSMGKQDKSEISSLSTYLNETDVQKMITRLNNIIGNLETMITQVDSYTFFGERITQIDSYDTLTYLLRTNIGDDNLKHVPVNESALDTKINNWLDGRFQVTNPVKIDWINQSGTQPKLAGTGTDKLNFYSYLYTHFNKGTVSNNTSNNKKEKKPDSGENLYDNIKSTSKTKAENSAKEGEEEKSVDELKDQPERPSVDKGANDMNIKVDTNTDTATSNASGNLSSMFSGLGTALTNMAKGFRDNIYVTDYVVGMFSYDTIEREFAEKNPGKEVKPLSITKEEISKENNLAYEREVEYVIYGGSNTGNVVKAYASIYGIRLGFNLIYAFMNSEIRETALAIATPISAATLGIVPVPLIQAAIIIGISCCESGLDLKDIRDGKKVVLFKSESTWRCSISGLVQMAKEQAGELAKAAIDYGDDKLAELLDKTDEELSEMIQNGADDLENTVGDAYDSVITQNVETVMQQFTTIVRDAIQKNLMDPATNKANYVKSKLDEWLAQQPQDGLVYQLKSKAVGIIKDQYVDLAISKMEEAQNNVEQTVDNYASDLKAIFGNIRLKITQTIQKAGGELDQYKTQMMSEIKDAAHNGTQKLKEKISEKFDGSLGGTSETTNGTGVASMLRFSYSDYLRLFVLLGMLTDQEGILLRTADVIQANMGKITGDTSYRMKNAAVYLELNATIQVKPTMLAMPLFAKLENNPVSDTNWYTIEYMTRKGY